MRVVVDRVVVRPLSLLGNVLGRTELRFEQHVILIVLPAVERAAETAARAALVVGAVRVGSILGAVNHQRAVHAHLHVDVGFLVAVVHGCPGKLGSSHVDHHVAGARR